MVNILRVIALIICICGSGWAGEVDLATELNKRITFDFDGMSLEKAIQNITTKSNLELIPLESVSGNNRLSTQKIYISVQDMPVEQVIEYLTRTIGAKYRIFPDGRVYLSENYEWVETNMFGMVFLDLDNIISGTEELQKFDRDLAEVTKIITLFDDNYYVRVEEQADMVKLVAHTPKELKPVFLNLIEMLGKTGNRIEDFALEDSAELDEFRQRLYEVKEIDYPYMPLNKIIKKLSSDFNVNIGFSSIPFSSTGSLPEISLKIGEVSLKEAVESIIEKTSFNGVEISLPNGIWLTEYSVNWVESVSQRFLWSDNIVIRSYDIRKINSIVPGRVIVQQIINLVAPRAWYDPLASVIYYEKNGSLIVIADSKIHSRVLKSLKDLVSRL